MRIFVGRGEELVSSYVEKSFCFVMFLILGLLGLGLEEMIDFVGDFGFIMVGMLEMDFEMMKLCLMRFENKNLYIL